MSLSSRPIVLEAKNDLHERLVQIAEKIAGSRLGGELLLELLATTSRHEAILRFCNAARPVLDASDVIDQWLAEVGRQKAGSSANGARLLASGVAAVAGSLGGRTSRNGSTASG